MFRLTRTLRFLKSFPKLITHLGLLADGDTIAVDFSDFGGFHVLLFAKRTDKGRALPLYFEIITYPIEKDSQNTFIIAAIDHFFELISPLQAALVFDRGFACPSIIADLAQKHRIFYIRIKGCKLVSYRRQSRPARSFCAGQYPVWMYDRQLSLTVTEKSSADAEPWYLVSNDLVSSARLITEIYYHRFEIEEFFKDAKRIFGLEYIKFRKLTSLTITLWFVSLGFWFQKYLEQVAYPSRTMIKKCKGSFNQSLTHYWLERIKLALVLPTLEQIFVLSG